MSSRTRGFYTALDALARTPSSHTRVCRDCRRLLSSRKYASLATAQTTTEASTSDQSIETGLAPSQQSKVEIRAGIVLSRPPLITPDPHPFETAYHLYQRRLNERLVLPFTQYFYYRRGTLAFDHWKVRRNNRGGAAARDIGKYNAYTDESWNDEVKMGDDCAQPAKIVESLIEEEGRGDEFAGSEEDSKMAGLRRTTEADKTNDQRSLERSLSRTLYLLVRRKASRKEEPENTLWKFPNGPVQGKEGLKEAAQRILDQSCGPNMNTWIVGNHPVGHYVRNLKALRDTKKIQNASSEAVEDEKTFFMKARIMAGQADPNLGAEEVQDFKWLSKDEIEKIVSRGYWSSIKNMLVEQ